MALTQINGADGACSLTTAHNFKIRTWTGNFSRNVTINTGFDDTGVRRKLGIFDLSGSAGGTMYYDAANTGPGINATDWQRDGVAINLGVVGSTACAYTATCVMSNFNMSVVKDGESTLSVDFLNSGGNAPTEAWDETP